MLKKASKKGFTLVELIVTIILLGIVGAIIVYNITSVSKTSKETDYERFIAQVKSAASTYADLNADAFSDLYVNKAFIYLTVEDLIKNGLLDEELENPYTGERIGFSELIKANLDSTTGAVVFEYPVEKQEDETFLVALSDYVVWGEPYDCMQGAGSYNLALSEEDGSLVMLNNAATIKKYDFKCSMPDSFEDLNINGRYAGKRTKTSGSYDIEYSWITSSGTRKSATRTLRVLGQVSPTFKTNYTYTPGTWFEPTYDTNTSTWKYLTYTPFIEGADKTNTTFTIYKKNNLDDNAKKIAVTAQGISDYLDYKVDDGDKTYYLETTVKGHYVKDYSYVATGEMNMKSKLIIPPSFITGGGTDWTTHKDYSINDTYSPVGLEKYEFVMSNDNANIVNKQTVNSTNTFKRTSNVTMKSLNILDVCAMEKREYKYIFFRAINEDGYVGEWTSYNNLYITNQLNQLISSDKNNCSNCASCCLPNSTGCYYCSKNRYLMFGDKKFVILENKNNGQILTAYDGVGPRYVSPFSITPGRWTIETCDGTFSADYKSYSPAIQKLLAEGNLFYNSLLPSRTRFVASTAWNRAYTSFVGHPIDSDLSKYKSALYSNIPYWTTTAYSNPFTVRVSHGESTTRYNTYYYAVEGSSLTTRYGGNVARIKPMITFNTLYVCSGQGTADSPYIVAA